MWGWEWCVGALVIIPFFIYNFILSLPTYVLLMAIYLGTRFSFSKNIPYNNTKAEILTLEQWPIV